MMEQGRIEIVILGSGTRVLRRDRSMAGYAVRHHDYFVLVFGSELWMGQGASDPQALKGELVALDRDQKRIVLMGGNSYEVTEQRLCQRCHGSLRNWDGVPRCWTCGWPFK